MRCYFVVLVCHYKYLYQIRQKVIFLLNDDFRFYWKTYDILREKHIQIMFLITYCVFKPI